MRQSLTRDILEHLSGCGKMMVGAFFPKRHPGTKMARALLGLDTTICRHHFENSKKITISAILSRLQKEGLVARSGSRRYSIWSISSRGKKIIAHTPPGPPFISMEPTKKDGKLRIVTFDIPERDRKKRDWLRAELISCGFTLLHKSVWIGKQPLPEEFVEELNNLGLSGYIHIFSVGEKGTLNSPRP